MRRVIEIQHAQDLPARLTLRVGDLLICGASGGHVQSGADVVEILGPFLPGVMGDNGKILSPMGSPSTLLFLARRPGRATIDVITGDLWHAPLTTKLEITIES